MCPRTVQRQLYFDIGGTIDTVGVPWVSIGLLIFF